jgi:cytochrome o ubiquinol oxidase operon protein cyoD
MSADITDTQDSSHAPHDGHTHELHDEHPDSTFKGYMTGFVLAVILTVIPFYIVMGKVFGSPVITAIVILAIGAVQMVVHMIYFLHMDGKAEGGWSMLALIFTLVLVVITLSGSMWVMYHMNHNMMPTPIHDMRNMP